MRLWFGMTDFDDEEGCAPCLVGSINRLSVSQSLTRLGKIL